jgi:uncharacterized protein (DUF58 family)
VDGDDVRSIDWRATARRRSVVVRTWRPERDRHVLIVVDTSRTSAARIGDAPRLDSALDATLLMTALTAEAGDRVDVLCMDRIPHVAVTGSSRRRVLHDVVAATAPVEPALVETDWELTASEIAGLGGGPWWCCSPPSNRRASSPDCCRWPPGSPPIIRS